MTYKGTITFYNNQRGFGFITSVSGETYFFHITNCLGTPVLEGLVEFEIAAPVAVGKKPQAVKVRYRKDVNFVEGFVSQEAGVGGVS